MVERFRFHDANTIAILSDSYDPKVPEEVEDIRNSFHGELIALLQYTSLVIRPNITFEVSEVSQFLVPWLPRRRLQS
jgi:hypothetical protein